MSAALSTMDMIVLDRLDAVLAAAVDVDEVAAFLEASGVNDRVAAARYDEPTVFALAARLLAEHHPAASAAPVAAEPPERPAGMWADAAVRAVLYLTPAVLAVCAADLMTGLAPMAGTGALIAGWGLSQALASLGYLALGGGGPALAARILGGGFLGVTLLWLVLLPLTGGADARSVAVAVGQFALFAATGAAIVCGVERRVLAVAVGAWVGAGVVAAGLPALRGAGLVLVAGALAAMVCVAYRPGLARTGPVRWRPTPGQLGGAAAHGLVGAGQAVLFVAVVLAPSDSGRIPLAALPLLLGVPQAELVLRWHQRRVAAVRARLSDRYAYGRSLTRVSLGTLAALSVPVLAGAALVAAGAGRLAAAVLLTGVYALGLVLVAHRRLGLAALLVWWPAALVAVLYRWVPGLSGGPPALVDTLVAVVLFAICVPALGVVAMVLKDRWSYR